jgi:hypothetical protein
MMILAVCGLTFHVLPLLAALTAMTGAGSLLVRWLQAPQPRAERAQSTASPETGRRAWGWSYLLGVALVGLILQVPLMIDGKITQRSYLGVVLLCIAMALAELGLRWREKRLRGFSGLRFLADPAGWIFDLPLLPRMLMALCLTIFVWFALVESPITVDARAIYGLKARLLYDAGDLGSEDFHDPDRLHYHANYPLLVPLVEATLYFAQGTQQDLGMELLFAGFVLAGASILFEEIRRFESPGRAAMWGAFFLLLPCTLMPSDGAGLSGSVDFALAAFATAAVIAAGRWLASPRAGNAVLAGLMLGAAVLTKQEGTVWLVAIGAAMAVTMLARRTWPWRRLLVTAAGIIGIAGSCMLIGLVNRRGIPDSPYLRSFSAALHGEWIIKSLSRIPFIADFAVKDLTSPVNFALIWPFIAVVLLVLRRPRSGATVVLWRATAVFVTVAYFAIFTITPLHLDYQLRTAFSRLAVHVLPLLLLVGAEQLAISGWSRQMQWIFTGNIAEQTETHSRLRVSTGQSIGNNPQTILQHPSQAVPQLTEVNNSSKRAA